MVAAAAAIHRAVLSKRFVCFTRTIGRVCVWCAYIIILQVGADAHARSLSAVSADRNRRISRAGGRLFAFMNNMIILINGSRVLVK